MLAVFLFLSFVQLMPLKVLKQLALIHQENCVLVPKLHLLFFRHLCLFHQVN